MCPVSKYELRASDNQCRHIDILGRVQKITIPINLTQIKTKQENKQNQNKKKSVTEIDNDTL